jgi:hypothetical protein
VLRSRRWDGLRGKAVAREGWRRLAIHARRLHKSKEGVWIRRRPRSCAGEISLSERRSIQGPRRTVGIARMLDVVTVRSVILVVLVVMVINTWGRRVLLVKTWKVKGRRRVLHVWMPTLRFWRRIRHWMLHLLRRERKGRSAIWRLRVVCHAAADQVKLCASLSYGRACVSSLGSKDRCRASKREGRQVIQG